MECCDPKGDPGEELHCFPCDESEPCTGPLIDAHCHINLSPLLERHETVINEALKENISDFVVNGVSPGDDWNSVQMLHEKFPDVIIPSYGLHPHYILNFMRQEGSESWEKLLEQKLKLNSIAGVGECGLDKMIKKDVPLDFQVDVLQKHLDIAKRFNRNVSIHCVQAWGTLYDVLLHSSSNEYKAPIILHSCNSIPLDFIHQFAKNIDNVYFSLNGRAIHSPKEISVINAIPLNRMLLETDSPSQIPMELKGMTLYNEPKLLNFSFNLIAKIRIASGVDAFPPSSTNVSGKYNLIRKKVYENSIRVFRALSRV